MANGNNSNSKGAKGLKPEAIAAGVAVALGIAWLATRKGSKCKKLPDVWHEDGPLYMTQDAFDDGDEYIRRRIREHIIAGVGLDAAELQVATANHLESCAHWGDADKMSDNQKKVWKTLGTMIDKITQEANANSEAFLAAK